MGAARPLLYVCAPWRRRTALSLGRVNAAIRAAVVLGWAPVYAPYVLAPALDDDQEGDRAMGLDAALALLAQAEALLLVGEPADIAQSEGCARELARWRELTGGAAWMTPATLAAPGVPRARGGTSSAAPMASDPMGVVAELVRALAHERDRADEAARRLRWRDRRRAVLAELAPRLAQLEGELHYLHLRWDSTLINDPKGRLLSAWSEAWALSREVREALAALRSRRRKPARGLPAPSQPEEPAAAPGVLGPPPVGEAVVAVTCHHEDDVPVVPDVRPGP